MGAIISSGAINLTPEELAEYDLVWIITETPQVTMTTLGELTMFLLQTGALSYVVYPADFSVMDFSGDLDIVPLAFLTISEQAAVNWPTDPTGLPMGSLWTSELGPAGIKALERRRFVRDVASGTFVSGSAVFFGQIKPVELFNNGVAGMPLSDPHLLNRLWLNGSYVSVSLTPDLPLAVWDEFNWDGALWQ